MAKEKIP